MLDVRVQRTIQRLNDALIELTLERDFHTLTVRELTARAEVGYATFFRHFSSKEALLHALLDDTLHDLMRRLNADRATLHADLNQIGTTVFRHAQEHTGRYQVLLNTATITDVPERCKQLTFDMLSSSYQHKPESVVPFEVAVHHMVYSFIALISWYLAEIEPPSPEHMGKMLEHLILRPTHSVAFEPKPG